MDARTPIAWTLLVAWCGLGSPLVAPLRAQAGGAGGTPERLQAEDRAAGDLFACALSLAEGRLLAGSLLDDDRGPSSGSAYVFDLGPEGWAQSAKLLGADTAAGDRFGFSVALAGGGGDDRDRNRDRDLALIGAPLSGSGGAAYRFERLDGAWRQTARWVVTEPGADAGAAVALVGDGDSGRALVGVPLADSGGRADAGAVLVYRLDGPGGQQPVRLEAPTPRAGAGLGWAVAGSGRVVAAGAPWADAPFSGAGVVVLFESGADGSRFLAEVTAPDAAPFQAFGYTLDLAGDLLVVGAPRDGERGPGAGAVYLFRVRDGGVAFETKIPGTVPGDQYGTSVAVAADGLSFAVGARGGDGSAGPDVGYVDLFERAEGGWVSERRIQPAAAAAGDEVGIDVALSGTGSGLGIAVGAYKDDGGGADAGAAYVLTPAADLALTKRLESPASGAPAPGEEVVYVVEVENRGPGAAFGARVLDSPPAGLAAVVWTCAARGGARCAPAGTGAIDDRVDLPVGSGVVYRLTGTVPQGATGALVNRASVETPPGLFDPDPDNGADEVEVPVGPPRADLYFDLRFVSGPGAVPGDPMVHEVEIGNLGPSDAPAFQFSGGGLGSVFVAPGWSCTPEGGAACVPAQGAGPIAGTLALPAGGRVVYRLEATANPSARGTVVLAGGLGPLPGLDPDPSNNSDRVVTTLDPRTDLAVGLSGPSPPSSVPVPVAARRVSPARRSLPGARQGETTLRLRPGETAIYEAVISSSGPSDARAPRVLASLPAGLEGAGWSCTAFDGAVCPRGAGEGILDDRPELPPGSHVVYSFIVRAIDGFLGSRPVAVDVAAERDFEDPSPSDNRAQAPGPVLLPDLAIAVTLEALGPFVEGGVMTYEILIGNGIGVEAPDEAGDELLLPLPPEIEVVSVAASAGEVQVVPVQSGAEGVAWNGVLPVDDVVAIRVDATIRERTRGSEVSAQATLRTLELAGLILRSAPPGAPEPVPTTFVVQGPRDIPTASQWALMLLALLLGASALGLLHNGRTA